jgi:hypothetical protein
LAAICLSLPFCAHANPYLAKPGETLDNELFEKYGLKIEPVSIPGTGAPALRKLA